MRPLLLSLLCAGLLVGGSAQAQTGVTGGVAPVPAAALARDYTRRQEHEKAAYLYDKLKTEDQTSAAVLPDYLTSLLALKRYKEAEKVVKKAIRQRPEDVTNGVVLGTILAAGGDATAADKQYQKVVAQMTAAQVPLIAQEFSRRELPTWAERSYLHGRELSKSDTDFAPQLIQLYTQSQQQDKVLSETLRLVQKDERQLPFVRNMLQNALHEEKDFDALEKILLKSVQDHPDTAAYSELLLWLQVQRRDFAGALMQARALDRRSKAQGSRVLELGAIAEQNKDYESAIDAYTYVVKEYHGGPFYNLARQRLLQAREAQVKNTYPVDLTKVRALVAEYESLLTELGRTAETAPVLRNLANLYAFQLNEQPKAMTLLQEVIDLPRASSEVVDEAKITLGDLYLLKAEPWEATLLYSQVEKSHKETPLGYEAKLRNARLSYFAGDFKLAQSHLDILKEATTREIANDAMQLSLLIQDNTVEDTLGVGLRAYAAVEQLVFQNKLKEAIAGLDALLEKYPGHSLTDDAWYLKAQLLRRTGDFPAAISTLERITNNAKYDVLSDDALFLLARIQEEDVKDRAKAQELYNQVLVKYPGSIYVAEARKRFRKLRGDGVQ
jgi:tetratricopeptide (TPR) repeat protein